MDFLLFISIFLLSITLGMCWRLELRQKEEYDDSKKKIVKQNQIATITCGLLGIVGVIAYCLI